MIGLILSLHHPIDMIGDIRLDMTTMIIETTTVNLRITIGITGIEIPTLDITIMGMTGQIEHLAHNNYVQARIRAFTKVTTPTPTVHVGQNRGYRQYDNHP